MGTPANRPTTFDPLLRKVADFDTAGVILAPRNRGWLFRPCDGGIDVITAIPAERDAERAPPDGLSQHPGGL